MTVRSTPAVTRLGDAPALSVAEPPFIHVHRTRTAGWQVIHVTKSGKRIVLRRRQEFRDAMLAGAAAARVNECRLEVDR